MFKRNPKYIDPELATMLSASRTARENWFEKLSIGHVRLTETLQGLLEAVERGKDTRFIFLIGMTGAGKSSLAENALSKALTDLWGNENDDEIPFMYVTVDTNNEHTFAWSNLYCTILNKGTAIPSELVRETNQADGIIRFANNRQRSLPALRQAISKMAEHRALKLIILDESYRFLRFDKIAVMDTVKSFSEQINVKLIFIGSYELLELASLYAQAIRRTEVVPFFRYDEAFDADIKEFRIVVEKFSSNWPCNSIPNFPAATIELLSASMGGVGHLATILSNFLHRQLRSRDETWTSEMFGRSLQATTLTESMKDGIRVGEAQLRAKYGTRNHFCTRKGIKEIGEKLSI